jgi:hypothetical protein
MDPAPPRSTTQRRWGKSAGDAPSSADLVAKTLSFPSAFQPSSRRQLTSTTSSRPRSDNRAPLRPGDAIFAEMRTSWSSSGVQPLLRAPGPCCRRRNFSSRTSRPAPPQGLHVACGLSAMRTAVMGSSWPRSRRGRSPSSSRCVGPAWSGVGPEGFGRGEGGRWGVLLPDVSQLVLYCCCPHSCLTVPPPSGLRGFRCCWRG